MKELGYIVGIDTGGTFTDGIVIDTTSAIMLKVKVRTTPFDLTECFVELLKSAAEKLETSFQDFLRNCESIRYSHTIATNTLITRTGTKLGVVCTYGHKQDLYSNGKSPTLTFIEPEMVSELEEEIGSNGEILKPISRKQCLTVLEGLIDSGARSIVVSLKNAFSNPVHEKTFRDVVREEFPPQYLGRIPVFLSHEVAKIANDELRTNSAVVDAYVHAKMANYLYKAEDVLKENRYMKSLTLVNSDGALSTISRTKALATIGSGPAAGVIGAYLISTQLYDSNEVLTFDVGGTSLDLGFVGRVSPAVSYYLDVEGCRVFQPTIDVRSVAIGGGSIVKLEDGKLRVGPESVGSFPGPVCFDNGGTELTVTDANLLLGYLDPRMFHGGRIVLNSRTAADILQDKVANPLGLELAEACLEIRRAADKIMASSFNEFIAERKLGDRIGAYCFGGGGPVHACGILSEVPHLDHVRIFPFSSEFSAMGCCMLNATYHAYREIKSDEIDSLDIIQVQLAEEMIRDAEAEGHKPDRAMITSNIYFDRGRSFVPLGKVIEKLPLDSRGPLILSSTLTIPTSKPTRFDRMHHDSESSLTALRAARSVHWRNLGSIETNIYDMEKLRNGDTVIGPAIIQSDDTTVVLEPSFEYRIDAYETGVVRRTR